MSNVESYPETWDDVEKGTAESSKFLKLKSGESVKFKVVNGPYPFRKAYVQKVVEGKDGKMQDKSFTFPFGTQIPGLKLTPQFAFEVVVLDGPAKGQHKVWVAGQRVAEDLKKIADVWGSVKKPDIVLSKTGEKLETKWNATAAPPSGEGVGLAEINLKDEIKFSTKEELALLPNSVGVVKTTKKHSITDEQTKFISNLCDGKSIEFKEVEKIIARKFDKASLDDLSKDEAAQLIDTLKAM
jgi:hypothetical protein